MKQKSKTSELLIFLETVLWDSELKPEEALELLAHPGTSKKGVTARNLYVKILAGCNWYTLLKIFPVEQLKKEILADEVVDRLFPPLLRQRYRYARSLL